MAKLNDFDLDVTKKAANGDVDVQWKSKSFCTGGCITGALQTCFIKTVTCGCHIDISK